MYKTVPFVKTRDPCSTATEEHGKQKSEFNSAQRHKVFGSFGPSEMWQRRIKTEEKTGVKKNNYYALKG